MVVDVTSDTCDYEFDDEFDETVSFGGSVLIPYNDENEVCLPPIPIPYDNQSAASCMGVPTGAPIPPVTPQE